MENQKNYSYRELCDRLAKGLNFEDGTVLLITRLEDKDDVSVIFKGATTVLVAGICSAIEKILSELDMVNGATPSGVTSGTAIENLVEIDNTRLSLTGDHIRNSVRNLAVMWLEIYKRHANTKRILNYVGKNSMVPQLDKIIESNKALSSDAVPMDEKYITAYAIAKGIGAINTPPPSAPTAEQLMEYYNSNPEFQQMIEQKRLGDIKQSQQVPAMSASGGAVNAALNIQEKPKTWDDASKRTRAMFGLE